MASALARNARASISGSFLYLRVTFCAHRKITNQAPIATTVASTVSAVKQRAIGPTQTSKVHTAVRRCQPHNKVRRPKAAARNKCFAESHVRTSIIIIYLLLFFFSFLLLFFECEILKPHLQLIFIFPSTADAQLFGGPPTGRNSFFSMKYKV